MQVRHEAFILKMLFFFHDFHLGLKISFNLNKVNVLILDVPGT